MQYCSNGTIVNAAPGWCNSTLALLTAIGAVAVTVVIVYFLDRKLDG